MSLVMIDSLTFQIFLISLVATLFPTEILGLGIQFTTPGGGATWPAGPLTAQWEDAGGSPGMKSLTSYSLELMVGGNAATDSMSLQPIGPNNGTGLVADGTVEGIINADVAQSIENGFYLRMTSKTVDGDQVINYSDRFTLVSMRGSTDPKYINGANGAGGDSNVPEAQYNVFVQNSPTSSSVPATSAATNNGNVVTVTAPNGSSSSTGSSIAPTAKPEDSHGIPTPAIIGITIGATAGLILLLLACTWRLYLHRKNKKAQQDITREGKDTAYLGKAELPAGDISSNNSVGARSRPEGSTINLMGELSPDAETFEAASSDKTPEVQGTPVYYELESDWNGWEMTGSSHGRQIQQYDPTRDNK
ncbi:hypothetical protein K431DRAFT_287605 [Polychaeton citri CBS 116435]|uniref:Yeast cell wall synthesis Kre9/Knh1-like N-terminal domain-containing protein n=1 Tax=Polychaeton citri CBS 116435 TaxID=1314669 RepID=A0A9P4Q2A0_9PEZI|nr:hypothetical protein K431DRAFT_287605 [Polychaeton citri CBS 116435]